MLTKITFSMCYYLVTLTIIAVPGHLENVTDINESEIENTTTSEPESTRETATETITTCFANSTLCTTALIGNATIKPTVNPSNSSNDSATVNDTLNNFATHLIPFASFGTQFYKSANKDVCTCDLQLNFCDINCCCDKDCTFENKFVFNHCIEEANMYFDTKYCEYMEYIYVNNTPYEWQVNQNGLFCIAKSNLPERYTVSEPQSIESLEDADFYARNLHSWRSVDVPQLHKSFNLTEVLHFGSVVWCIKNNALPEPFVLPDRFITNMCIGKKEMHFLENVQIKCNQNSLDEFNPHLNAETYFKNISIISAPYFFNTSWLSDLTACPRNVCLSIEAKICDEYFENCANFSKNDTRLKVVCHFSVFANENSCLHVTEKIKYNFFHNGTWGFTKVEAYIILKNVTHQFDKHQFTFLQNFEVNYFWTNHTFSYSSLLSGNPGYISEKPILTANLVNVTGIKNYTSSNVTKYEDKFEIRRNPFDVSDNFLVVTSHKRGICFLNNHTYTAIEFGTNMILKCKIVQQISKQNFSNSNATCRRFQDIILKYWSLRVENSSKLVGNFGNANSSIISDWSKIIFSRNLTQVLNDTFGSFDDASKCVICRNITADLKIHVFHSRVSFSNLRNQEKIVGATYRFGQGKDYKFFENANAEINFEVGVRVEVWFFDITTQSVEKFVDPPSFHIRLPYDFFYPFVKVDTGTGVHSFVNLFCLYFIIMMHIFMHSI